MGAGIDINESGVEYREITGYPGYRIGSNGVTLTAWKRRSTWYLGYCGFEWFIGDEYKVKPFNLDHRGYPQVTLSRNRTTITPKVHRLVLEAFVGLRPVGMECRHADGNKLNNNLDNLSWSTHIDNCLDRIAHGTESIGENNPAVKITAATVPMIRDDWSSGMTCSQLSKKYGLSIAQVHKIATRKVWKSVA